jgi:hypothetical protein
MRVRFSWMGLAAAVWLAMATQADADEVTGRWTGELEARGNYYYERSTRVMVPTGRIALESPNGIRVNADYLLDAITSASIPSGAQNDQLFTELRHGIGAGVGKRFALGENDLDLSVHGIYSTEPDYKSWIYGAAGAFSFNDKNSTLSLALTGVSDKVYAKTDFRGDLDGVTVSAGLSQLITPTLIGGVGYQFTYLGGYLGNPYRKAPTTGVPLPEKPPSDRLRYNLQGQLSWFIPQTNTTLLGYARLYTDSWKLNAITPEFRVYQMLGRDWVVRLRYRLYDQGRAYFARAQYPANYPGLVTGDPKLFGFHSHQAGLRITYTFNGLTGTVLDFARRVMLDVSFDVQLNSSSFGNNMFGTLGGRFPF